MAASAWLQKGPAAKGHRRDRHRFVERLKEKAALKKHLPISSCFVSVALAPEEP